ncbi:helix-turn-helix transcriptional regulator [Amycolatopsis sp.]|uniref:helix-turn-helix domain-containing protein n=1 Tax=Amycolatopsis sp. TaxID=37632 RepID=UPI002E060335|nr:helix-turn-helix transcriptional regulator [Amycolatopsis sp.]
MTRKEYDVSSARRRELGNELKFVREQARLSGHELARIPDWAPSKISRYEGGQRTPSELDVAVFLTSCGVKRTELERLLELAREADATYWVRPHSQELPDQLRSLMIQESSASAIRSYEPLVVPGLLQTEGYARAVFQWMGKLDADTVETLVNARISRQSLLRRRMPPKCTFYIHERALRSVLGGKQVMHEQMLFLGFSASLPHCSIRVIPESSGHYAMTGSFKVLDYAAFPPAAYAETYTAGLFVEEPRDVATYCEILEKLDRDALNGRQSVEWLAELASGFDRAEEHQNDVSRAEVV